MLNKTFEIGLNTKLQGSQGTDIIVNQGDTNSVVFNFRIYDGANEINYNDVSIALLVVLKPDKHTVQQNMDATDNGYTVTLSQQALAEVGTITGRLALYGHKNERITTLFFNFRVERDVVTDEIIESTTEFDALQRAITLLNELIALYEHWPPMNHAQMNNLDFESSGHTGFASQEMLDEAISTIPSGGLRIPIRIELESIGLPDPATLTADNIGDFYIIQTMDTTAGGHTGKAWVNYQDNNPANPIIIYKVHDHYYSADGESIIITPSGQLAVSATWLESTLEITDVGRGVISATTAAEARGNLEVPSLARVNGTTLPDFANLNMFMPLGVYHVVSNGSAETMVGIPVPLAGVLEVLQWGPGTAQRFTAWPDGTMFTRIQLSDAVGHFGSWNRLHDSVNLPIERGTWVPRFTARPGVGGTAEFTHNIQEGLFFRTGNKVHITATIGCIGVANMTADSDLGIGGLPFANTTRAVVPFSTFTDSLTDNGTMIAANVPWMISGGTGIAILELRGRFHNIARITHLIDRIASHSNWTINISGAYIIS